MWKRIGRALALGAAFLWTPLWVGPSAAFEIEFEAEDFGVTPTFSNVQMFWFSIEVAGPLRTGVYDDPPLMGVEYRVLGTLTNTPSHFPSFDLERTIGGAEFYTQGSSLQFEVAPGVDLSDGLQVSELVGDAGVFVFNGRELDTGRYHPALLELNMDGTGLLRNSNNMGGINPASMEEVDVEIGEEYVTALTFDPSTLTLVPEPSAGLLLGSSLLTLGALRRRENAKTLQRPASPRPDRAL
jgi:hypothetical protein